MTEPHAAPVPATLVVVDTDVFSRLFVRAEKSPLADDLRARLSGRIVVIAAQTEAELRTWPLIAGWGPKRIAQLDGVLANKTTVGVNAAVIRAMAELTAAKAQGHAIHAKDHTADRWVAATAIALERPLLALDGVYGNAPGLTLLP